MRHHESDGLVRDREFACVTEDIVKDSLTN